MNHPEPLFSPIPRICISHSSSDNVCAKQSQPAKDQDAYELLERIEKVAETWCVTLLQQKQQTATPSNQEHERIIHFCQRTLQQIVDSRNRRKKPVPQSGKSSDARTTGTALDTASAAENPDVSPPLQPIPLPLWNLLPGTVMALHYWYHQVARRCQYRESIRYFAGLLTAAHGDPRQQQRYVQICETQAQLALSVQASASYPPPGTTSTTNSSKNALVTPLQDPEGVNYSIVDAANFHVQQCISSKAMTTLTNSQPLQHEHHHRHSQHLLHQQEPSVDRSSPQSVVLLDHQNCWVPAIVPQLSPVKTENPKQVHPVAIKTYPAKQAKVTEPIAPVPSSSEMLASLFHASRCRHSTDDDEPCFFENCATYKSLWSHIVQKSNCNDYNYQNTQTSGSTNTASVSNTTNGKEQKQHPCVTPHCLIAKQSLRHFRKCKQRSCIVCGPVLQLIPQLKQDIEQVQQHQPQLHELAPTVQDQYQPVHGHGEDHRGGGEVKVNGVPDISDSDNFATAEWTAAAEAFPPTPSTSPLRRSAFKRKSNRGPLKKRHRVKFASSWNENTMNDTAL